MIICSKTSRCPPGRRCMDRGRVWRAAVGSEQRGAREAMGYRRVGSIHAQCCAAPALINISTSKEGRSATVRNEIATKEASFWLLTVGFRLIPCSTRVYLSFSFPEVCTFLCSSSKRGPSLFSHLSQTPFMFPAEYFLGVTTANSRFPHFYVSPGERMIINQHDSPQPGVPCMAKLYKEKRCPVHINWQ